MEAILEGLPMVSVYLDDILVSGKTQQEHLANLNEVYTDLSRVSRLASQKRKVFVLPI